MFENSAFWLFTATVFVGLLLPVLVQQGMFLDGVSYACIARNMANGLGSFSKPFYTVALYPVCHEQPPLVFWLQSQLFKVFGDHFWVERLYSFCMAVITAIGIVLNFQLFQKAKAPFSSVLPKFALNSGNAWLPVLIWVTAPIVIWSYQNNMLECTMSVFVLFSTYFAVKAVMEKKFLWLLIAAILTTLGVLCKGPVGFFPVMAPLAVGVAFHGKRIKWEAGASVLMFAMVVTLLAAFVLFLPGMLEYMNDYLQTRLLPTLSGNRDESADSRLHFLFDLVSQFALPVLVVILLLWKQGFKTLVLPKSALFFFLVGLAGTFPLILSPKQSTHYLLPAIPFFALGLGAMTAAGFRLLEASIMRRVGVEKIAWLVLVASIGISLSFWGKYRRDESTMKDVRAICQMVSTGTILGVAPHFSSNWKLIAYFGRLGNVGLDSREQHDFYLTEKGGQAPEGYDAVWTGAIEYEIWHRK